MTSIDTPGDPTTHPPARHDGTHHDQRLHGRMGVGSIIFMVVAAAAPLTAVGAVFPVQAMLGNGVGTPVLTLASSVILMLVTVGLSTMASVLPKPGAFFTYVGHGLGRAPGLGAAWLAILTYTMAQAGVYAILGAQLESFVSGTLGGPDIKWWVYTLAMVAVSGVLGYRHLELSAKVLGVMLVLEIGIVLLLSVVALVRGGHDGVSMDSFEPSNIGSGSPALGAMFAISSFLGFESTAVFRDEAKEPERTIPRATYGAVILVAVFYTFTQWALVLAVGVDRFPSWIPHHLGDFIMVLAHDYLGAVGARIVNVLLLTSLFACVLSFHNVLTRYQYSMAVARVLPRSFAKVHHGHGSPHVSSLVQTATAGVLIVVLTLCGLDPILQLFTWFGGVAMFSIVVLMALTTIAVISYLTTKKVGAGLWRTWIAPGLGLIGLLFVIVVQTANFPLLLGEPSVTGRVIFFYCLIAAFPVLGVVQALWLRARRPADYDAVLTTIGE
jgi:amino acid transporter